MHPLLLRYCFLIFKKITTKKREKLAKQKKKFFIPANFCVIKLLKYIREGSDIVVGGIEKFIVAVACKKVIKG